MALALALAALVGCRDSATEPGRMLVPNEGGRADAAPATCRITLSPYDPGNPISPPDTYGNACGTSWDTHVAWIFGDDVNANGMHWFTADMFSTSGFTGAVQNGPLTVNLSPAVTSATITLFDSRSGWPVQPGPAGTRIVALNAQGATLADVTSDGVAPSYTVTGSAITQLKIYPKLTGQLTSQGDTYVVPAAYQIDFVPIPCPTGNPISDNPIIRKFLKAQLDTSIMNGRVERSGPIYEITVAGQPPYLEGQWTTIWSTQCRNDFSVATQTGYRLVGIWHTHAMVPGSSWTNCPTSQGAGFGPGKHPSPEDYQAEEKWNVPEFIFDLDDIWRIDPHPDTSKVWRDGSTWYRNWSKCANFFASAS
jgi:hypothetical protein